MYNVEMFSPNKWLPPTIVTHLHCSKRPKYYGEISKYLSKFEKVSDIPIIVLVVLGLKSLIYNSLTLWTKLMVFWLDGLNHDKYKWLWNDGLNHVKYKWLWNDGLNHDESWSVSLQITNKIHQPLSLIAKTLIGAINLIG